MTKYERSRSESHDDLDNALEMGLGVVLGLVVVGVLMMALAIGGPLAALVGSVIALADK